MTQRYKGRLIDPHPYELADRSGWCAEVYIAEDSGNETVDTQYLIQGRFASQEAATQAAINSARRVIDRLVDARDARAAFDAGTRLPAAYRRGLGHENDDVAEAPGKGAVKVCGPDNPEDHYT